MKKTISNSSTTNYRYQITISCRGISLSSKKATVRHSFDRAFLFSSYPSPDRLPSSFHSQAYSQPWVIIIIVPITIFCITIIYQYHRTAQSPVTHANKNLKNVNKTFERKNFQLNLTFYFYFSISVHFTAKVTVRLSSLDKS